jgi:alpha-galactosidase
LTEDEAATLTSVTAWYKANRAWMTGGDILRLDSADPSVTAEVQIAADRHRFVVFAGQTATSEQVLPRPLRLTGLDPDDRYKLRLINSEDAPKQSRGPNALKSGPLTLTGRSLMSKGLLLPVAWPATMWVIEGQKL